MEPARSSAIPERALAAALLIILGVAAWWRVLGLGDPGLWLDEILGVRGVGPEHGPVYYAVMRATTGARPDEVVTRLPFATAGLLTVAAAFACGRAISGRWLGVAAAAVVAAAPVHVYYSREARPYAFLVLAGFVGLGAAIRLSRDDRPWRWLLLLAGAAIGAVLTSANGIFVAAALLGAGAWAWPAGRRARVGWLVALAATAVACLVLVRTLYPRPAGTLAGGPEARAVLAATLPLLGPMVSGHLEQFPVRPVTWAALAVAVAGAALLARRTPRVALALATAACLGLILPAATMLWLQHPISARYALAGFPGLALLIAAPAVLLDRARRPPAGGWLVLGTCLLLAALAWAHGDARRAAFREKADWRRVAAMVVERTAPGDTVVVSSDWAEVCLGYYLPAGAKARRLVNVREDVEEARRVVGALPRALLVTGGAHLTYEAREWMRRFHPVWDSAREDIAITYYPDRSTYLAAAITPAEIAADEHVLRQRLRSRIDMTVNAERFLLAGWQPREIAGGDTPFRRAEARAAVYLPVATRVPTELATRARLAPDIPDRRLDVWLNGRPIATVALDPEWRDLRVPVPAGSLTSGANFLELRTPGVAPGRGAAAAFQAIEIR